MFSQNYCLKGNNPHACPQMSVSLLKIKHLAHRARTHLGASALEQAQHIQHCITYVTFCIDLEGTERKMFIYNAVRKELCWSVLSARNCFAPYKSKQ